jgi:hypothetical protein
MTKLPWPSVAEPTATDIAEARSLMVSAQHIMGTISKLMSRNLNPIDSLVRLAEVHQKLAACINRKHLWAAVYNGRILTEVIAKNEAEAREKANTIHNAICSPMGIVEYQAWIRHAEYKDLGELKG